MNRVHCNEYHCYKSEQIPRLFVATCRQLAREGNAVLIVRNQHFSDHQQLTGKPNVAHVAQVNVSFSCYHASLRSWPPPRQSKRAASVWRTFAFHRTNHKAIWTTRLLSSQVSYRRPGKWVSKDRSPTLLVRLCSDGT